MASKFHKRHTLIHTHTQYTLGKERAALTIIGDMMVRWVCEKSMLIHDLRPYSDVFTIMSLWKHWAWSAANARINTTWLCVVGFAFTTSASIWWGLRCVHIPPQMPQRGPLSLVASVCSVSDIRWLFLYSCDSVTEIAVVVVVQFVACGKPILNLKSTYTKTKEQESTTKIFPNLAHEQDRPYSSFKWVVWGWQQKKKRSKVKQGKCIAFCHNYRYICSQKKCFCHIIYNMLLVCIYSIYI